MTNREKFIILVDNDIIINSDAIIILEGDGLSRINHAIRLYKEGFADKIIFSGGIVNYDYGSYPFNEALPIFSLAQIPTTAIIYENISTNTREQAVEVIKLCLKNNWHKIILVASHYHQYRAYLTFLKEILELKYEIILMNSPVRNLKWFETLKWGIRYSLLVEEFKKINEYTSLGHLCSFDDAIEYQKWKEKKISLA